VSHAARPTHLGPPLADAPALSAVPAPRAAVGVLAGAAAMVFVGGSVAVSALLSGAALFTAQAVRYTIACLLLLGFVRVVGARVVAPRGVEWGWLLGVALTGLVVFNIALVHGSAHAEPAVLGVAVACVPLILAVFGPLLERHRPSPVVLVAAVLVTGGAALVTGVGHSDGTGLIWAVVVLCCEAGFTLLAVLVLTRHGAWGLSVHTTWLAAAIFAVLGLVHDGPGAVTRLREQDLLAVAYLAVAVTAVAFVLWYSSVGRLGAGRAGLLTVGARRRRGHRRRLRRTRPPSAGLGGHRRRRRRARSRTARQRTTKATAPAAACSHTVTDADDVTMHFQHSPEIWRDFPELVAGAMLVDRISADASVAAPITELCAVAAGRLATGSEGEFAEVQAWRRAFSRMGLKPTQYRCAAEALLRRYRKEGSLPSLHPLINLCNAASLAFAIPVAPRARRGDLRRQRGPGARPPMDQPAEWCFRRTRHDHHRPDRRRGAARHGRPRRARATSRPRRRAQSGLAGHPGHRSAHPIRARAHHRADTTLVNVTTGPRQLAPRARRGDGGASPIRTRNDPGRTQPAEAAPASSAHDGGVTKRRTVSSGARWESLVGYSRAVRVGQLVSIAGTTAAAEDGGAVGGDDIGKQAREALRRIQLALEQAGARLEDVVRTRTLHQPRGGGRTYPRRGVCGDPPGDLHGRGR